MVDKIAGVSRHAKGAVSKSLGDVFGCLSVHGDFDIVDGCGAVHGDGRDVAAFHEVDEYGG